MSDGIGFSVSSCELDVHSSAVISVQASTFSVIICVFSKARLV